MSTISSPPQVTVKLDKVSFFKRNTGELYKWLEEAEQSKHEADGHWKEQCSQLEQERERNLNTIKWLRVRIGELEESLGKQKPDIDNAVAARNAALQKLKHARKVIRDLLAERDDMRSSPRKDVVLSQDEINEALYDEFMRNKSGPSTPKSAVSTVRQRSAAPTMPSTPSAASPTVRPKVPFDPNQMVAASSSKAGKPSSQVAKASTPIGKQASAGPSSSFQSSRPSPPYPTSLLMPETTESHNIHYSIPSSHQVVMGPFSKEKLHEVLDLTMSDADALGRIEELPGLGMKLHLAQSGGGDTMAFLYSPAFIDGSRPGQVDCQAVEWGRVEDRERTRNLLRSKRKSDQEVVHTFTHPTRVNGKKSRGWFYLGAMRWIDTGDDDDNFILPEPVRVDIVRELYRRTKKTMRKQELLDMMGTEEIVPFKVTLKKVEDMEVTMRFLRQHEGLKVVSPDDSSSSLDRVTSTTIQSSSVSLLSSTSTSTSVTSLSSRSQTLSPSSTTTLVSSSSTSSSTTSSSSFVASSTSSLPVTSSSSFSSSLSSSTRSSITTTASVVSSTTNSPLNIVPATTMVIPGTLSFQTGVPTFSIQTQPTETPSSSSAPVAAASTSSPFWDNKAAVVSTFIVVAVAICGIIGLAVLYFLKKRNTRMERELHEELFEKYTDPHRSMSPISSINGAPPIDPFASDNDLRVRHMQQTSVDSHHSSQRGYHSTSPVQHPDFYDKPSSSAPFTDYVVTSTYLPPSQTVQTTTQGPPSAFRNAVTKNPRSSYQPSVDSFYGGIAQGPSTGYVRP
ncbi:hypothetical protein CVT24_010641 [Panaeolus cyanescens]|uniref:Uncharacterized protein n=1 Tax=Panaeolus cyanescens TaxID=181874 RepID=A0A409YLZ6_9AGAR|nr:hypothetical protein CVT24_010641 [Panaeolus cyanescens]